MFLKNSKLLQILVVLFCFTKIFYSNANNIIPNSFQFVSIGLCREGTGKYLILIYLTVVSLCRGINLFTKRICSQIDFTNLRLKVLLVPKKINLQTVVYQILPSSRYIFPARGNEVNYIWTVVIRGET